MREYDPNTMIMESSGPMAVVCALCDEPFIDRYDLWRMTMAELDTACQRHRGEVHEHPDTTPM